MGDLGKRPQFRTFNMATLKVGQRDLGRHVRFLQADGSWLDIGIRDGQLEIRSLEGSLVVEPRSANLVAIKGVPD